MKVTHDSGETLMSALLKKELISGSFCGGRGKCQRCRVQFLQGAPLPTSTERIAFTPDELRRGYRLACVTRPKNSCVIRPDFISLDEKGIITDMIAMSEKNDFKSQSKDTGNKETGSLIAVDLGTTTIAMQLMDMESGQVIDTYCAMNPQRRYGADVLSRIQAANMGHAGMLRDSVWQVLQDGVDKFRDTIGRNRGQWETEPVKSAKRAEAGPICCMCIAGNTTMEHLLMGLSTADLGRSPFVPVELGLQKCTITDKGVKKGNTKDNNIYNTYATYNTGADASPLTVYITPGISAFVGGDIVAGLYGCNLLGALQKKEEPDQDPGKNPGKDPDRDRTTGGAVLFIDLGTNGEMAITDGKRMIVTATAAGPAFEGGAGAAVQGSDMIAVTAALLAQGIIDETGLLAEPYFEDGITVSVPKRNGTVHLTQKDIRDLQMAKAAVRAGVEILYERMGRPAISQVYLAGGFGYYLDVDAAVTVGLLPKEVQRYTRAAGNTSLAGAFAIGRDLWTHRLREEALMERLRHVESINLAKQDGFEELYLQHLHFPPMEK